MANPTTYTDELAEMALEHFWGGGTWPQLTAKEPLLKKRTFQDWCRARPALAESYKAAMEGGAGVLIDETRTIVDNLQEPADSRKLRAWQRFEEAKRKAPRLYGDRQVLAGDPEAPLQGLSLEQINERLRKHGIDPDSISG